MKKIEIILEAGEVDINLIHQLEKKIGYSFPESYRLFISKHNAAYLVFRYVDFRNTFLIIEDSRDINFLGYGNNVSETALIDNRQDHDIYGYSDVIAFAESANGDYICFDYRQDPKTNNPPIVIMYHDMYDDNKKMYIDFIAKDFDTLMNSLYGYDDNDQKIYPE